MSRKDRNYGKKVGWYCVDGPYKGREIFLHNGATGTLSFKTPGHPTGRYVRDIGPTQVQLALGITHTLPDNRLKWEVLCQQT